MHIILISCLGHKSELATATKWPGGKAQRFEKRQNLRKKTKNTSAVCKMTQEGRDVEIMCTGEKCSVNGGKGQIGGI